MPGWYWPDDAPKTEPAHATSSSTGSTSQPPPSATSNTSDNSSSQSRSSKRTHWPPRQCRICLETVQPTFNVPSQSLPGFLQSSNVVYEDESGRLIRPCMCKGSSKYVHEACLQAWRHADPSYGRRNYWQCPTCGFKYRLARLGVGRFIGSAGMYSLSLQQISANVDYSCSGWFDCHYIDIHRVHPRLRCRSYHQPVSGPMEPFVPLFLVGI